MNTNEFIRLLEQHPSKSLLFEYTPGRLVAAGYHITEVMQLAIRSVDCGKNIHSREETLLQLWEPEAREGAPYMSAHKALGIVSKVNQLLPVSGNSEIRIEYGNSEFHTARFSINEVLVDSSAIRFGLQVEKTECKAREQCGLDQEPVTVSREKEACCEGDSLCC